MGEQHGYARGISALAPLSQDDAPLCACSVANQTACYKETLLARYNQPIQPVPQKCAAYHPDPLVGVLEWIPHHIPLFSSKRSGAGKTYFLDCVRVFEN